MTNKDQHPENRLGHDPLEWLEHSLQEEEATEPEQTDSPHLNIEHFSLDADIGTLMLPERLLVQMAESFHADLCAIVKIEALKHLNIDARNIENIDTTGVQLLYALAVHLQKTQRSVDLIEPTDTLLSVLHVAGLDDLFEKCANAS
ncbi:STAS domain-containing protein [Alteromonas sp. a30]|uniref:STAS domain-containing protein n=1 Tax=Alteromonas sp. a30 TaxID=2730917 RepID=UPI002281F311|nr:STAS domain-containing protein [Alteromonas sp. a30]MCY7295376.1 STAS domain-containing protein [Alteromonas sp. a30]